MGPHGRHAARLVRRDRSRAWCDPQEKENDFFDPPEFDRSAAKAYHDALPQWLRDRMHMHKTAHRTRPRTVRAAYGGHAPVAARDPPVASASHAHAAASPTLTACYTSYTDTNRTTTK